MTMMAKDGVARPLVGAALVIAAVVFGFAAWAAFAPVSGAVIAEGRFKVDGEVKKVQHLEGGIVDGILVRNGDRVRKGDVLLTLDATDAEAALAALTAERDSLTARQARLEAERDDRSTPDFDALPGAAQPGLQSAIRNQAVLFKARRAELDARVGIMEGSVARLAARLNAQEAELQSLTQQIGLVTESADSARSLAASGVLAKKDLNARERELVALTGSRNALLAGIVETEAAQSEARLAHARARTEHLSAVSTELSEVVARLASIAPRITAETRRMARARITAPVDGVVFGLALATVGGVVGPGEPILEIVPEGGTLVAEARLAPSARERLREGMAVELRLPGVRSRPDSKLPGRIDLISAELTEDPADTGGGDKGPTYAVRIALAGLPKGVKLEPGMPVTSVIPTEERTAFEYLVSPLSDAMTRSMRER